MTLISPAVAALFRKRLTTMSIAQPKKGAAWLLIVPLLMAGWGWAAHRTFGAKPPQANQASEDKPPKQAASENRPRTDAYGDPLPSGAIARLGCMRLRHGVAVSSIAYSPDGKILASGGRDGSIRLWDVRTAKEIRRIRGHDSGVYSIAFSGNGKLLASSGNDGIPGGSAGVWDVGTGKRLLQVSPKHLQPSSVALSADGKVLAAEISGGAIYLWDVNTQKVLHRLQSGSTLRLNKGIAFSPDGTVLFSADPKQGIIRRWNVAKGEELRPLEGHMKGNGGYGIDVKGQSLVSSGHDGCRIWDLTNSKERIRISGGKDNLAYPTFSPDGKTLAGIIKKQIHLWDVASGKELRLLFTNDDWANDLAFSPEGTTLAWSSGGTIYLADPQTGRLRFDYGGHRGPIDKAVFSSDGTKVFTSGMDKTTRIWEARTGRELHRHKRRAAALSPDGKTAASMAEAIKGVRLWDLVSGKDLRQLPGGAGFKRNISDNCTFSADGKYVAAWGGMKEPIRVWETASGKERRPIPINWLLGALAVSPDGQRVAAAQFAGLNKPTFVWDIDSGREIKALPGRLSAVNGLAFSPDSTRLAVAGTSPCVQLWDVHTGEECGQLDVPRKIVGPMAFAPDGRSLATVGWPVETVYLWEITTGKIRRRFDGLAGGIRIVAFSPDGKLLVTGGGDGTLPVWDVMDVAPSRQGREAKLTATELADCWASLGSEDAEKAWQTTRTLVAGSEQTVAFLRERLSAQADVTKNAARWIAKLDDDSFAVRERASRELAALGKPAIPTLRKAQASSPSAEVVRRVKDLLAKLDKPGLSSAELANLRAIEVLEYLGTAEARQLLAKLAKGAADARRTQEAKGSLRRLEKRAKQP